MQYQKLHSDLGYYRWDFPTKYDYNFELYFLFKYKALKSKKTQYATICKANISNITFEQKYWFQGHSGIVKLKGGGSIGFLGHVTTIWAELPPASVLDRRASAPGAAAAGSAWVR